MAMANAASGPADEGLPTWMVTDGILVCRADHTMLELLPMLPGTRLGLKCWRCGMIVKLSNVEAIKLSRELSTLRQIQGE